MSVYPPIAPSIFCWFRLPTGHGPATLPCVAVEPPTTRQIGDSPTFKAHFHYIRDLGPSIRVRAWTHSKQVIWCFEFTLIRVPVRDFCLGRPCPSSSLHVAIASETDVRVRWRLCNTHAQSHRFTWSLLRATKNGLGPWLGHGYSDSVSVNAPLIALLDQMSAVTPVIILSPTYYWQISLFSHGQVSCVSCYLSVIVHHYSDELRWSQDENVLPVSHQCLVTIRLPTSCSDHTPASNVPAPSLRDKLKCIQPISDEIGLKWKICFPASFRPATGLCGRGAAVLVIDIYFLAPLFLVFLYDA